MQYKRPWQQPDSPKPLWNGEARPSALPPQAPPVLVEVPKPVLLSNEHPRRDLRRLLELVGQRRVERELNVHRTTIARWVAGTVSIPGAQLLAIRSLLGDLPGTAGRWSGWRFHDGELLSPAGDRYTSGEILSLRLRMQQADALVRENQDLRQRVKILEATVDLYGPAANESQTA